MSDRIEEIKSYLPDFISSVEPFKSILEALGTETGKIMDDIKDVLDQFFIETATWGLIHWETFVGIVNTSNNYEDRRTAVKLQLRLKGNVKSEKLVDITEQFYDGEIEVTEKFDEYSVFINLLRNTGTTPDFNKWIAAIREMLPAHLDLEWDYPFNRYSFFKNITTYERMGDFTWKELREQLGIENL